MLHKDLYQLILKNSIKIRDLFKSDSSKVIS